MSDLEVFREYNFLRHPCTSDSLQDHIHTRLQMPEQSSLHTNSRGNGLIFQKKGVKKGKIVNYANTQKEDISRFQAHNYPFFFWICALKHLLNSYKP